MSELATNVTKQEQPLDETTSASPLRRTRWLNIPNALTASRVVLTPVFLWLFFAQQWYGQLAGIAVFTIASLTDLYDGHFARKREDVTNLGRFLDPLADKILVSSALIAFVIGGIVSAWMVAVIVIRDFLITGLRIYAIHYGKPVVTSKLAKWKTTVQLVAIFVILGGRCLTKALVQSHIVSVSSSSPWMSAIANGLVAMTMLLTVISGIRYLISNRQLYWHGFQAP